MIVYVLIFISAVITLTWWGTALAAFWLPYKLSRLVTWTGTLVVSVAVLAALVTYLVGKS